MMLPHIILLKIPYIISFALLCISLYGILISEDRVKKVLCLGLMQTGAIIFFMSLSKVDGNNIPFITPNQDLTLLPNPVPHVLMLTAIVVSVATLAVALALIMKLQRK